MTNPYILNPYQHYSPQMLEAQMSNMSPTFHDLQYLSGSLGSTTGSLSSTSSASSSASSNYSLHNPRMRYYLSKSFDLEDDLEFCPEIPENFTLGSSPTFKKFNPYTASVFSPTLQPVDLALPVPSSPRVSTLRIKKPIEIVNPHTKMRVGSPAIQK